MPESASISVFDHIQELYQFLKLPTDRINQQSEFDIHNLGGVHTVLPFESPVFRANYFSFVFVKNATGWYTTGEQRFDSRPGTIYFTNPGHYKSFAWHQLQDVYLVTMSEAFLKENVHADIFEEFSFLLAETVPPKVLNPVAFAEFDQLFEQILREYTAHSPYRNRIIGALLVVLLLKIKAYFWQDYNPIYEGNRSSQIVREFKRYLEQHFREVNQSETTTPKTLRLQECAEAQHLHPTYLSSVIKTKTGKSIGTWIIEKTIGEAKAMLQNTSLSIKEVAYRLGFGEPTHFSNYFKKYTGVSPVLYRKQR